MARKRLKMVKFHRLSALHDFCLYGSFMVSFGKGGESLVEMLDLVRTDACGSQIT